MWVSGSLALNQVGVLVYMPHQSKRAQSQEVSKVGFRLHYSQGSKCSEMGLALFPQLCDAWLDLGGLTLGTQLNGEEDA